ncbi:MAG: DUF4406 domain-containing protein [Salinivirgaceae bacterium]|jgi:hypothetical protein
METSKKIYIAGKVTGEDYQKCLDKFRATEELLTEFGFLPINPMKIVPQGTPWQDSMDILKPHLRNCDTVLFLPDWKDSDGAAQERDWAVMYDKRIIDYADLYGEIVENVSTT